MIGNDIVDLNLAVENTNWRRKGYLEKLFTPAEQEIIFKAACPERKLWLLWAMKEATYKANQRKFRCPRSYNPKSFICEELSSTSGKVNVGELSYYTQISIEKNYLHCISSALPFQKYICRITENPEEIKQLLIREYKLLKNLSNVLTIYKDDLSIPYLTDNKKIFPVSFSISHHGKFSAFALALINY